jgi:hypothetical protein
VTLTVFQPQSDIPEYSPRLVQPQRGVTILVFPTNFSTAKVLHDYSGRLVSLRLFPGAVKSKRGGSNGRFVGSPLHTAGRDKGDEESVLTHVDLGLEFVVDNFEQLDDVRVPTLLHDSNLLANLSLRFADSLGEGCVTGGRYWRLASELVQLV